MFFVVDKEKVSIVQYTNWILTRRIDYSSPEMQLNLICIYFPNIFAIGQVWYHTACQR